MHRCVVTPHAKTITVPSLRLNFIWLVGGTGVQALCNWAVLVVLAKLGSPEVVGLYALALAIVTPALAFSSFQLREALTTDTRQQHSFSSYLRMRLITSTCAAGIIGIAGLLSLTGRASLGILAGVAAAKIAESISDILYGELQREERMSLVSRFIVMRSVSGLVLFGAVMWITRDAVWATLSSACASILALALLEFPQASKTERTPVRGGKDRNESWKVILPLLFTCLPLAVATLMSSLTIYAPRYFIAAYVGKIELGAYAVIHSTLSALYIIQSSVGGAAMPRLARHYANRNAQAYKRTALFVMFTGILFSIAVILIVYLVGPYILAKLYTKQYAGYGELFLLMAFGSGLTCLTGAMVYFLQTMRLFSQSAWILTINAILIAAMAALLVPKHALHGAIWSIIFGTIVTLFLSFTLVVKNLRTISTA